MVFTCTTRRGATLTTVTGTTRLSSAHTWVMPTFSPTIAFDAIATGLSHRPSFTRTLRTGRPGGASIRLGCGVPAVSWSAGRRRRRLLVVRTGATGHEGRFART